MDYHLQFRFNSLSRSHTRLTPQPPTRFPISNPPGLRSHCSGHRPGADQPGPEPHGANGAKLQPQDKRPADVRAQVKQLQFWLKVFSRFCHDETEQAD
jgi:hypothetical protein